MSSGAAWMDTSAPMVTARRKETLTLSLTLALSLSLSLSLTLTLALTLTLTLALNLTPALAWMDTSAPIVTARRKEVMRLM